MIIALFGATGMTGQEVLQQLLEAGHHVRALVRDPAKINTAHENLELITGDVFNVDNVRQTMKGTDGVISCLGIGGMGDGSKTTLVSEGTRSIVAQMPATAMIACISNTGVGNSRKAYPWKMRNIDMRFSDKWKWFRAVLADKQRMEHIVRKSGHAYTVVRSPQILNDSKRTPVQESRNGQGIGGQVTKADLAAYLIAAVVEAGPSKTISISSTL